MNKGFDGIDAIPPKVRPEAIAHVAKEVGVPKLQVLNFLQDEWDTSNQGAAQKTAGSDLAAQRTNTHGARQAGTMGGVHARMSAMMGENITVGPANAPSKQEAISADIPGANDSLKSLEAELMAYASQPKAKPQVDKSDPNRLRKSTDDIMDGLQQTGKARLNEDQPYGFGEQVVRKLEQFDQSYLEKGIAPGDYAHVDLKSIADDDPRLDMPLFRGMNSQDPATHALGLTGQLIPAGHSSDYEGFKRYDHKETLNAYEWSADPYIAMKGAGAHGFLVQTTLREIRDQGGADISRKTSDSEGGFFIASPIQPRVRRITHPEGSYNLEALEAPKEQTDNVKQYAGFLARKVPQHGGWDEFLDSGNPNAKSMNKRGLRETLLQVQHWSDRVKDVAPNSKTPGNVFAKIKANVDVNKPKAGKAFAQRMLQDLQMAFVMATEG